MATAHDALRDGSPAAWLDPLHPVLQSSLSADPTKALQPETLRLLRDIASTSDVTDCPVNLTRAEVQALLELIDTRAVLAQGWAQTLDWGLRCARMAQRLIERSGFANYATWIEHHRVKPMQQILDQLPHSDTETVVLH
jgi:hypothetical protein